MVTSKLFDELSGIVHNEPFGIKAVRSGSKMNSEDSLVEPNRDQIRRENERLRTEIARLKRGAVNQGFVQVSRKHLDDLDDLAFRSPAARKLLTTLVKAMDKQNAVMVAQESLVKLTGLSKPTVKRAIALLREQNWIEVVKVGTANVYRVNSGVFWTARADGRWASFSAQILANFDEQDEVTKATPTPKLRHIPFVHADEDVLVSGTSLGSDDPPEQSQLDFHKRGE